ncbi:probable cytochrome P450 6a14 [Solenopsis invicta]|uniref:probable cytochrome P450 6a14 n=1 Tax=Solenopsis invicta TaxID=13686 RepID=UPI00193C94FC|nr:probable cytochrome P450 6a14 [Solenopsis invicta]XP_039312341.1 probable cytochrome P450 6a14 [Solenopsis invicta]XP_039312342.1 probable cytochrome P450 6a14 [Solenopsis invicta]XP_039312343.1 probable cytochrome P450 6a14 [Solenopsis invicta]XP_039312344.1 probable cytochrome P450 6a14 [Solenopsis invicta]
MVLAELIAAFIVILSSVYIYYKYVIFNFWRKRGVFYIEPVVPVGNVTPLVTGKAQVGVFFHDVYLKYKEHRAFGMYTFFKPNLIIADLDLIQTVMTKEFKSFHDRGIYYNEKIDPLTGNLFLMPGKRWRNMRVKLTPTFTSGKMKQMFVILKECGDELAKHLERNAEIGDTIEIKDILARYTTDVIMSTAFGIKSNCIKEPNNEYRIQGKRITNINSIKLAMAIFAPQIMTFFSIPFMPQSVTDFYIKMFRETVEYRQANHIVRPDFMNLLIQLMERGYVDPEDAKNTSNESSTVNKLTMVEATAQSFVFFAAGFETSSSAATFVLYELAQHQDIQEKVHNEIDEILKKHNNLTYDAITDMTYLHKVINEALRLYPPVPILNRICTEEIDLPTVNIRVPKGTLITIPMLGLHRDPSIYPDPNKFDPERFNANEIKKRHHYAYMPFGEGPRNCIGMRFGLLQTKIGLVSLLSKYKFKLHSQTPVPLTYSERSPTLIPKSGVHLIIEKR